MGFFSELPCFFDPDFSCLFFQLKKGTFLVSLQQTGLPCTSAYDGISIWKDNPLCVAPRVGYYAFFLQRIARPRNARIRFYLFYQKRMHGKFA